MIVLIISFVVALVRRFRPLLLLSLPSLGGLIGTLMVRYGGDRFLTPLSVCLTLVMAAGLGELFSRQRRWPRAVTAGAWCC